MIDELFFALPLHSLAIADRPSMSDNRRWSRRAFMAGCSGIGLIGGSVGISHANLTTYAKVALVDADQKPIQVDQLEPGREHLFFYPYVSTPCFLINLGERTEPTQLATNDGQSYSWTGGIGEQKAIVAYAAICTHRLSYPTQTISFIGYRNEEIGYVDPASQAIKRRRSVIQCCSEHSIYDPSQGAKVLSGPAPQPLAAIALATEDNQLYASGVYGGAVYQRFFELYEFKLNFEYQGKARELVSNSTVVVATEDYTEQSIRC